MFPQEPRGAALGQHTRFVIPNAQVCPSTNAVATRGEIAERVSSCLHIWNRNSSWAVTDDHFSTLRKPARTCEFTHLSVPKCTLFYVSAGTRVDVGNLSIPQCIW